LKLCNTLLATVSAFTLIWATRRLQWSSPASPCCACCAPKWISRRVSLPLFVPVCALQSLPSASCTHTAPQLRAAFDASGRLRSIWHEDKSCAAAAAACNSDVTAKLSKLLPSLSAITVSVLPEAPAVLPRVRRTPPLTSQPLSSIDLTHVRYLPWVAEPRQLLGKSLRVQVSV